MPRRLLLLALTSAACFSDDPPQLTATLTGDSSSDGSSTTTTTLTSTTVEPTTDAPTTSSTTGTTEPVEPTTTSSSSGDPTTDTGETTGEPIDDPCKNAAPVCPGGPAEAPGSGLEAIDRCNFPLARAPEWDNLGPLLDELAAALPTWTIGEVLTDLDETALGALDVPGSVEALELAFRWAEADFTKTWWIPQGLTGTVDAYDSGLLDGREALLVSWHFDQELAGFPIDKGVRITLVDITDAPEIHLRHILLVEPVPGDPVDFQPVPIQAGGIVWYGDMLYVADTSEGLRVFDLSRLLEVNPAEDEIGYDPQIADYYGGLYSFVAVQIGAYKHVSACGPKFSTLGLDRSASPPELVVAEYCDNAGTCDSAYHGRLYSWPIDPVSGRLPHDITWPSSAAYTGHSHLQGAVRRDGTFYLSSSAPPDDGGELYVAPPASPSASYGWIDSPQAVMLDGERIWSLSEKAGARFVFAASRAAYE